MNIEKIKIIADEAKDQKIADQLSVLCGMQTKVSVTKFLYKSFDSYRRRERWLLKKLLELVTK